MQIETRHMPIDTIQALKVDRRLRETSIEGPEPVREAQVRGRRGWQQNIGDTNLKFVAGLVYCGVLFYPFVFQGYIKLQWVVFACLVGISLASLARRLLRGGVLIVTCMLLFFTVVYIFSYQIPELSSQATADFLRVYVLVPVTALATGLVLNRVGDVDLLSAPLIVVSLPTAALAVYERLTNKPLIPGRVIGEGNLESGSVYTSEGTIRAIVGAEHPLVLASLFACALPLVVALKISSRLFACAALLGGIWATGSEGLLAVATVIAVLVIGSKYLRRSLTPKTIWPLVAVGLLGFVYYSVAVWRPTITSVENQIASFQYRTAMYSLVPDILSSNVFGYGLGDAPQGQLYVSAPGDYIDISRTIDSEYVLLVVELGIIGVLIYAVSSFLILRYSLNDESDSTLMRTGLVLVVCGVFLALHVWATVGSLYLILVGYAFSKAWSLRTRSSDRQPRARKSQ